MLNIYGGLRHKFIVHTSPRCKIVFILRSIDEMYDKSRGNISTVLTMREYHFARIR